MFNKIVTVILFWLSSWSSEGLGKEGAGVQGPGKVFCVTFSLPALTTGCAVFRASKAASKLPWKGKISEGSSKAACGQEGLPVCHLPLQKQKRSYSTEGEN